MHPLLYDFGPFQIRTYGVFLSVAFMIGVWIAGRRAASRGIPPPTVYDLAIVIVLSSIAGARAYFVLVHHRSFAADPLSALKVWEGGLSMYGGVLAAIVASYFFSRSRGVAFKRLADVVAPTLAIGVAITRIGCYFNGCCFGKETSSFLGVIFPPNSEAGQVFLGKPVHPTQLYSSLYGALIFLALLWVDRRPLREGALFGVFLILYSVMRSIIDLLRYYDPASTFALMGLTFTYNQAISLFLCIYGLSLVWPSGNKEG